jgi:thioredoxin-dependent peroxiredoxin
VLRTILTTAGAIAEGIANKVAGRFAGPTATLEAGDRAPDFALTGSDGRTYRLSSLAGRAAVIAWFPKAFTGGCTAECKSLRSNGDVLRRFDVQYFAVSVDKPETNAAFAASLDLDYPILSDPTRDTARAWGVLDTSGFAQRWTFIVGPDGRILAIDRRVSSGTHGSDIGGMLKALGVQEHT